MFFLGLFILPIEQQTGIYRLLVLLIRTNAQLLATLFNLVYTCNTKREKQSRMVTSSSLNIHYHLAASI